MIDINSMIQQVLQSEILSGALFISVFMGLIYSLKGLPLKFWNWIKKYIYYEVYIYETDNLFVYFEKFLNKNYNKKYRKVEAVTEFNKLDTDIGYDKAPESDSNINKKQKKKNVFMKQYQMIFTIKYNKKYYIINKGREKFENTNNLKNAYMNHYNIKTLFYNKRYINKLLNELVEKNIKKKVTNTIYANNSDYWIRACEKNLRSLKTVVLNNKIKNEVINALKKFNSNKSWYKKRGIPYKLGILLHGPPGNGKTSLIQAIANEFKKDIYYLNLGNTKDDYLARLFRCINENSIIIIEDIDALFKSKREMNNKDLTFSGFINVLDGLMSSENVVSIFTTNKKLSLDEALMRPGRIDFKIEIPNPTINEIKEYYKLFFNTNIKIKKLIKNISMAEVQDIFLKNLENKDRINKLLEGK